MTCALGWAVRPALFAAKLQDENVVAKDYYLVSSLLVVLYQEPCYGHLGQLKLLGQQRHKVVLKYFFPTLQIVQCKIYTTRWSARSSCLKSWNSLHLSSQLTGLQFVGVASPKGSLQSSSHWTCTVALAKWFSEMSPLHIFFGFSKLCHLSCVITCVEKLQEKKLSLHCPILSYYHKTKRRNTCNAESNLWKHASAPCALSPG